MASAFHRASLLKKALFLNQFGEPYAEDGKSLNRIINETGKRVGIRVHTHILRHTYATHTLVSLQRNPRTGWILLYSYNDNLVTARFRRLWCTCI